MKSESTSLPRSVFKSGGSITDDVMPIWVQEAIKTIMLPVAGLLFFLLIWGTVAQNINTSLGKFPGPTQAFEQFKSLIIEHNNEREKEVAFYQRQETRNADRLAQDPSYQIKIRNYTGKPTFIDQTITSLITVLTGFILASIIAIPFGIMIGLSKNLYAAANPIIQLFKPVSPLAWLPLVTMVVSAVYTSDDPLFAKSFITSVITVLVCSIWPTVINTAVGTASISQDLFNVSKVLRLKPMTHVFKVVIPSAIPMIFTGLRLSLGIAWMVLIAAEMLAQNPGLGKFVWDEFQNGSSNSLGRIMVAVLVIGFIGFLLDRIMLALQKFFSWDKQALLR